MRHPLLCTATALSLFLFVLVICMHPFHVYADAFYDSGGDTFQCSVSLAPAILYSNLPVEFNGEDYGGVHYAATSVTGQTDPDISFDSIATDIFPHAQRFPSGGYMSVSVPPGTQISIYGLFKNANTYDVHVPDGGLLYTSLKSPQDESISRLFAGGNPDASIHALQINAGGNTYTRSGTAVPLPSIGTLPAQSIVTKNLYTFTTITPLQVTRTATYAFNANGELIISFSMAVTNQSAYEEDNIQINDDRPGVYAFDTTDSFAPGQTKNYTYQADFGINYPRNITLLPVSIFDPNKHTEIFQTSEVNYDDTPDATSIIFPRDDSDSPAGWSANQTDLTVLDTPTTQMYVTLLPYTLYSSFIHFFIAPDITIHKTQTSQGVTDNPLTVKRGDSITYSLTIANNGNAAATNVFVLDPVSTSQLNIIDPKDGTICEEGDVQISGYTCHDGIGWSIGTLAPGDQVTISFVAVVAHGVISGEDIRNMANVQDAQGDSVESNITDAQVGEDASAMIPDAPVRVVLAAFSSLASGSVLGVVWHDSNANAVFDANETPIANVPVVLSYTDNDITITRNILTDIHGQYSEAELPLAVLINVSIQKPSGYMYESTYSTYAVTLSADSTKPTGDISQAHVNGTTVTILSNYYFNAASLGVYNMLLADTGQNISGIFIVLGVCLIGGIILLVKELKNREV